jgi:hypothetical protein
MKIIDIFSLMLSLLGVHGIVFSLRLLLPRNIVPLVSTSLKEAMAALENAEAINIPNVSDFRTNLAMYAHLYTHQCLPPLTEPNLHNQFSQMRTESHRSPSFFQQVYLLFLCGCRSEARHVLYKYDCNYVSAGQARFARVLAASPLQHTWQIMHLFLHGIYVHNHQNVLHTVDYVSQVGDVQVLKPTRGDLSEFRPAESDIKLLDPSQISTYIRFVGGGTSRWTRPYICGCA